MSLVCEEFAPSADDLVKIAARGQSLEGWLFEEEGKRLSAEALTLKEQQKKQHSAARVSKIMSANGYSDSDVDIVRKLLLGYVHDDTGRAQLLEDLNGLVFIRFHASDLIRHCPRDQLAHALVNCLKDMSDDALYHASSLVEDPVLLGAISSIRKGISLDKKSIAYLD